MTTVRNLVSVPGYEVLRVLSERETSKVFIAREHSHKLCALKVQLPNNPLKLESIINRYRRIQELTARGGLVPVLAYGIAQNGWLWEAMPLADNLPGLPSIESGSGIDEYTPLTLRTRITESGAGSTQQVAAWGLALCKALATLHQNGLVHRDVKPANVLFINQEPFLADYGLVGEPGGAIDFTGTEGFQPLEGTNDLAADVFALGKTLYEVWTGCDRLEFPSLPRSVVESREWISRGRYLNDAILRACNPHPKKRFPSVQEFADVLQSDFQKPRALRRRKWLAIAGASVGMAVAVVAGAKWLRAPAKAVWRRVRGGFSAEGWRGGAATTDWDRRCIYSLGWNGRKNSFQRLDLDNYEVEHRSLVNAPSDGCTTILHPNRRELWGMVEVTGEVVVLDVETLQAKYLGGGPGDDSHIGAKLYWNPFNGRMGRFGGYGRDAVRNDRFEFDATDGRWVVIEENQPGVGPWPRQLQSPFMPRENGSSLLLVGGLGSPSGKQGEAFPDLTAFAGNFHYLDDVWELNLQRNTWRQWLPTGCLDPVRLKVAIYHKGVTGLLLMEGHSPGRSRPMPAETFLFRPGRDRTPILLPAVGDVSALTSVEGWALDPAKGEILILAADGVFWVTIQQNDS